MSSPMMNRMLGLFSAAHPVSAAKPMSRERAHFVSILILDFIVCLGLLRWFLASCRSVLFLLCARWKQELELKTELPVGSEIGFHDVGVSRELDIHGQLSPQLDNS